MKSEVDIERIAKVAKALKEAAIQREIYLTADDRVSEADAAALVDLSPASLKSLRLNFCGPAHYNRGAGNGSRVSYRIDDLAAWVERFRQAS